MNNPFFARLWTTISAHEPESITRLRQENLAGLSGRVLEVGAGTGTNFALYPPTVTEVVALEPEPRLAAVARTAAASVPVDIREQAIEEMGQETFDAVVCSLVLCSVESPEDVLQQLFSQLRPGGELRYLEHVAVPGPRGALQRLADATVWPRMLGNCHTHRDTELTIRVTGFAVRSARREAMLPAWVPLPTSEVALGCARRPQ
jgi:SAM-dependent methyltransferase